jgi:hypothetical protein
VARPRTAPAALVALAWLAAPAAGVVDPGVPGPLAVTRAEYSLGDRAFQPSGWVPAQAVEVAGAVHHPSDLSGGPFPVVVFLHGFHYPCHSGPNVYMMWPCPAGTSPIPSFAGFDYAAEILASHGYVVISVAANGVNIHGNSAPDLGALARAELLQHHLELWRTLATTGGAPFGSTFVGKLDLGNVGTLGHSRGGEGVARHLLLNREQGSPFGIRAVLLLAPVNFGRLVVDDVPLQVVLPYCDGDVTDLQGIHFFDDARYSAEGDSGNKHVLYAMGANHNYFNSVWTPGLFPAGALDDWSHWHPERAADPHCGDLPGSRRLTAAQQRGLTAAYLAAFFRAYLGGETALLPLLTGDEPPPPSALTQDVFLSTHGRDDPQRRLDVNRLWDLSDLTHNALGGAVTHAGLTNGLSPVPPDLCGGESPVAEHCLTTAAPAPMQPQQPHTTASELAPDAPGLGQVRLRWDSDAAWYQNDLPPGTRDLTRWSTLQFRAGVNFETSAPQQSQDFSVTLVDGSGATASARVGEWSGALFFPPGQTQGLLPKAFLNTVAIPLSAFAGIDLADVHAIRFDFDQTPTGAVLLSDIALSDVLDADGDGVGDRHDNCLEVANPDQHDANRDGFGNRCDVDVDEDGSVGALDANVLRACFGRWVAPGACGSATGCHEDPDCAESDLDGDGWVGGREFNWLRRALGRPLSPSGLACAGSIPCP